MELGRGSDGVREEVGFINAPYLNILYWPRPKAKRTCVAEKKLYGCVDRLPRFTCRQGRNWVNLRGGAGIL